VLPSAAVATLAQLNSISLIHSGSGLGLLRLENSTATVQRILEMRLLCQSQGGFLTLLEAPVSLKQQIDVWGYNGNSIDLMRRIKQQFDSENILSPYRFVGGI
jgi:glycolate oxidase FAD binding subunit